MSRKKVRAVSSRPPPRRRVALTLLATFLWGCGGGGPATLAGPGPSEAASGSTAKPVPELTVGYTVVADSIASDPAMEALVRPFREAMAGRIEEVIGEAAVELTEGRPEGNLGNFATDALLWATDSLLGAPAQLALMNNGGLRIPLARGPITVGTMFELMPFENMVAILTLTGEQVVALAGEIAGRGGEPIAGFSFHIENRGGERVARDVRIGGEPVDSAAHYRLVTNDYLANGGDDMPALTRPVARTDYPLLVRDAFIEYLKMIGTVEVGIEGRITGEVGR